MSRKPIVFQEDIGAAPGPDEVPPVPDIGDLQPRGQAMISVAGLAARRSGPFARLVRWAVITLIGMAVSVAAWDFVIGLLDRNLWLGRFALLLMALIVLGVIVFVLREVAAFSRLSKVDDLHARGRDAMASGDRATAARLIKDLSALYASREEMRLPRADLERKGADIMDADALLALAERQLMTPLDLAARREVELAARQVATVTALVPLALADVVTALAANVRMTRRVAEVYAGRAGTFGSWRLLRAVATHLVATGAVAVGDDLIGSVAGGGILSKVSRRFGEGVVNGALTARVGIAAIEVCRPMPFAVLPKPKVTNLVQRALTGLFAADRADASPGSGV